jgi:N utilization substance protein A
MACPELRTANGKEKTMLSELDRVLEEVKRDKGIDKSVLIETLETALLRAAKNKYGHRTEIEARFNPELGEIELFQFKLVVDEVRNPGTEIALSDARELDPESQMGDSLGVKMETAEFGRIAAQVAKQVIIQNIREAERENVYQDYKDRKGDVALGFVQRFDRGNIIVNLGKAEGLLAVQEQIPGEAYRQRDRIKAYILDVKRNTKGPQIILSRTHPNFTVELFKLEVPEISEGIVKVKGVAREPGGRAKVAVESLDKDVDPVGACVGTKGSRVQSIVQELKGERIDIIPWNEDPAKFVCNALSPAEVSEVIIEQTNRSMQVIVADDQLSLAIGKKGQNVRLAARLVGWKIDIMSSSRAEGASKQAHEQLVEIPGVGDATAQDLFRAGYFSPRDVARAKVEDLMKIRGLGEKKAAGIKESALKSIQSREESEGETE